VNRRAREREDLVLSANPDFAIGPPRGVGGGGRGGRGGAGAGERMGSLTRGGLPMPSSLGMGGGPYPTPPARTGGSFTGSNNDGRYPTA
jgi:hypothetical protein